MKFTATLAIENPYPLRLGICVHELNLSNNKYQVLNQVDLNKIRV